VSHSARAPARRRRPPTRAERGVALLVVLGTLTLVTATVMDFQFNSRVDMQLAYNARDGLQAEYNALSAMRLRALILRHARRLDQGLQAFGPLLGLDASMMPPIGQVLDMVPIDCGIMSAIVREAGSDLEIVDEAAAEGEDGEGGGFFAGECSATSESEHTKISINVMANVTGGANKQVATLLMGLLSNPAFERHFEEDDRNGTHAENPEELVSAIADWIDRDKNQSNNQVSDEDRFYANLPDDYEAKNAPFDSLAELALVHGIDDELYAILAPNVSIYTNETQIELATAPIDRIWWGLLSSVRPGVNAAELLLHPGIGELNRLLTEMRMLGGASFGVLKVAGLVALIDSVGLGGIIDTNVVKQVFTDKQGSTWYTIHAQGRVGNASRRITAVFQATEGQFYYVRFD
jgi:hypothetical protein